MTNKRNEEVRDIIDRMPTAFGRWVSISVIIMSLLFFLFGWLIKYPDVVSGKIKINSTQAPIRLVANVSGQIQLLNLHPQDSVQAGDYIAVIKNPANTEDIIAIIKLINEFNPLIEDKLADAVKQFPVQVSLGGLNATYYTFYSALKSLCDYRASNQYEQQKKSISDDIKGRREILKETEDIIQTSKDNLDVAQKWYDKYSTLNKDIITTYELEVDKSKSDYLSAKLNQQNLKKERSSLQIEIMGYENRLASNEIDQKEKERQLRLDLLRSYHEIHVEVKLWEERYVFISPLNGKVEFMKFLTNGQFIQSGEPVFGIIPSNSNIIGQMELPTIGAGKVKIGSAVTIRLDDYPSNEYGTVKGIVKAISLISQEYMISQKSIDIYLVMVDLPKGLTTNYGEHLTFQYEIGGTADIVINDRRLIQRLFDNIRTKTTNN